MKYLRISNNCEVDINAFKLLGACTKRGDDNKIGYFGSGLKYAMATFLRSGVKVRIFAGTKEIEIKTVKENFRDQDFEIITIDGEKTSLTTSMGPDWRLWQAVREIYCNALDEEGCELKIGDCEPKGVEGKTIFFIGVNEELDRIVTEWDKYFAVNRGYVATCEQGKMYPTYGGKVNIYRRGIRCHDSDLRSLWDYEFFDIEINESRTILHSWMISRWAARIFSRCANTEMLRNFVKLFVGKEPRKYFEFCMDWDDYDLAFSNKWLEFFGNRMLVPYEFAGSYEVFTKSPQSIIIPNNLIRKLKDKFGDQIFTCASALAALHDFAPVVPDAKIAYLLKESLKFLTEVRLPIKYKISIGIFANRNILGTISEDKTEIILAVKLFDRGKKAIVCTILEEWAHIDSGQGDETRGFQDYLIGQIVTLLENQHGVFL